jgi:GntR family transcriptional regulator
VIERDWRPRYIQLAEELREQILSGELPAGAPMPSETELAAASGMSRTSVRNAIRLLREWGLVRAEWEKDRVHASEEERRSNGGTEHDTGLTVDDLKFHARYSIVPANDDLAKRLGVPVGTQLLQRVYWTSARSEDAPLSMSRSYLVYDMVAANPALLDEANEPWPGGTQHQLYTIGIEVDRITDEITARPPMPDEAEVLRIESGVSVLALRKTSVDTTGRVVEVAETVYPGDRTELVYTIQLKRWSQQ